MQTPPKDQPGKKPGIIRVEGMHKWYGDFHVLKDLNLTVAKRLRITCNWCKTRCVSKRRSNATKKILKS